MSHFVTWVLVKKTTKTIEKEVARLLAPFDENTEVDPYEKACWCVGRKAESEASLAADKIESIEQIRDRFHKTPRVCALKKFGDDFSGPKEGVAKADWRRARRETDALWMGEVAAYYARVKAALDAHPDKGKPDKKCDECKGRGTVVSTYNPKSKWNWWVVGGRWAGEITKSPVPDDENPFTTGNRVSAERKRAQRQALDVNMCRVGDVKIPPVGDENDEDKYVSFPYAIVTPDGEWHAHGEMGWFGCSSNEQEDWPTQAREILSQYADCVAVACDLHI